MTAIQTTVSTVWNAISTAVSTVLNTIKTVVLTVWNAIKTAITTVMTAIQTTITTVWNVEGSIFRDMDGKAKPGIRSGVKSGHIRVTEEKIAALPDYLRFEKGIYIAFIKSGEVDGDTVVYKTNFGVKLLSIGNSRNLSSFLGFRRANPDGTIELLDEKWKVRGLGVCYSRRKVGEKRKSLSRKTE